MEQDIPVSTSQPPQSPGQAPIVQGNSGNSSTELAEEQLVSSRVGAQTLNDPLPDPALSQVIQRKTVYASAWNGKSLHLMMFSHLRYSGAKVLNKRMQTS